MPQGICNFVMYGSRSSGSCSVGVPVVCHIFGLKPLSPVGSGKCIIQVSFAVPVMRVLASLLPVVNVYYSRFICRTSHERTGVSLASVLFKFHLLYRSQECWHLSCQW